MNKNLIELRKSLALMSVEELTLFIWRANWISTARPNQLIPDGDWWTTWAVIAGRGFGKTRLGAEALGAYAATNANTRNAVIAPTLNDVRAVCIEGESGLLKVIPKNLIESYNKSTLEIYFINGSIIRGFGGDAFERLRGPQHHMVWCDELGAWPYPDDAYSMMKFGLRLGTAPKAIVTTTPKPIDLVRKLVEEGQDDDSTTIVTTGSTYDNKANLAPSFIDELLQYEGTNLGRQEIWAELLDPEEGGIVKRSWFKLWPAHQPLPRFEYIIQSYDVATSDKTINDPTACVVFGVFRPSPDLPMSVMMIDCWDEHMQYPDLRPKVVEEYESIYGNEDEFGSGKKVDLILIEDKSAGISLIQDLQRAGLPVRGYNPGRADKSMRLNIIAPLIMRGRVYLPESAERKGQPRKWCDAFLNQVCSFPNAKHDDYCDALSQALRILRDMGMISIDPQTQYDDEYEEDRHRRRENPYAM